MTALLNRARLLVADGPHGTRTAEVAAVHAAIYPDRDAVCQTCPAELGKAYYAIQRWATQQENSSSTSISTNVKKGTTARFHSDQLIYTPHGLGVAYTNVNLTDKAARDILKADPDAAQHFAVLPPKETEEEKAEALTAAQQATTQVVEKAQQAQVQPPATGFTLQQLASAMLDEMQRREAEAQAKRDAEEDDDEDEDQGEDQGNEQRPGLTASAGGAGEGDATSEVKTETLGNGVEVTTGQPAADHDDEQPVRLSRMNKEQLLTAYRVELRLEPAEGLTNDQLRDAIAEHRASQQDAE